MGSVGGVSGEAHLDDEDEDGILGVIDGGVGSLEDAALIRGGHRLGVSFVRWLCCLPTGGGSETE